MIGIRVYLCHEPVLGFEPDDVIWVEPDDPVSRLSVHRPGQVKARHPDESLIPLILAAAEHGDKLELVGAIPFPDHGGPDGGRSLRLVS